MIDFDDILGHLEPESDFEEVPVGVVEFIQGEQYLNRPEVTLSPLQLECVEMMTQIYRKESLLEIMHPIEADRRWKQTKKEIILRLGKGSGKDFLSGIACSYVVYQLLCLSDPAMYYGNASGDSIDIINIAINSQQAHNVFFKNVSRMITNSPWFQGRYASNGREPAQKDRFSFDKSITLYSGHSEREAWEGYNTFMVVLDEISGFGGDNPNNPQSNSASATYEMYAASVDSRFPDFGKLALLSFPRYKDDFISERYHDSVLEKNVVSKSHTFTLDPDLPPGTPGNEFTIDWDEDHITRMRTPYVYALSRASWEVNPNRKIEDYIARFHQNPVDALTRYACMPPMAVDAFFKDHDKIDAAFSNKNGVREDGLFEEHFKPEEDVNYYIHVDLAKKVDRCAVTMAHVSRWTQTSIGGGLTEAQPHVKVDAVRWWTPTADKNVDFEEVRDYIVSLVKRGFNVRRVTFDRWRSDDMITYLNSIGIKADVLSVAKPHYIDFATVLMDSRLDGPDIEILKEELKYLKVMPNDKIDHERARSKDLSDATCGAIYNCVAWESGPDDGEVEIITAKTFRRQSATPTDNYQPQRKAGAGMPEGLESFFNLRKL